MYEYLSYFLPVLFMLGIFSVCKEFYIYANNKEAKI